MTTISIEDQVSSLVLATGAELGAGVIADIAGNEISNAINGTPATRDSLSFLLLSEMSQEIRKQAAA